MKTIEEIINRHFATEKELDIIRIPPKFDFQNENQYFEVKGEMNYFVKIKKNLKKEFVNNKILEPLIRVPHIYEYNQTLDNTAEYIIEEYIDGVIVDEYTDELTMYLIGRVFGTAFNINAIPAELFAIVALAFNEAAYASETIRAAILSVDPGEIEAARSLGMTNRQVYRRIIIPNAAVVATPTLINSLIGLTKGTSLAFSASVVEIFAQARIIGGSDLKYFERFITVSIVYWIVNILIEILGRHIERRLDIETPVAIDLPDQEVRI